MNSKSILEARDTDLRLSLAALRRAAQQARELAMQTRTVLVVGHHGEVRLVEPSTVLPESATVVQEPTAPYANQR